MRIILTILAIAGLSYHANSQHQTFTQRLTYTPHTWKAPIKQYSSANLQAREDKQRLDSTIVDINDTIANDVIISIKYSYTYDGNGRQIESRDWLRPEPDTPWILDAQFLYTYDDEGRIVTYTEHDISQFDSTVILNGSRDVHSYDGNGNLTETISYTRDMPTGEWIPANRREYSYDAEGLNEEIINSFWHLMNWVPFNRTAMVYDASGHLLVMTIFDMNGSGWENDSRYTYVYSDTNDNLLENTNEIWDGNDWTISSLGTYTYDVDNNLIEIVYDGWDSTGWTPLYRFAYTYDENNRETSRTSSSWDGTDWELAYQEQITYDSAGNLEQESSLFWDSGEWVNSNQNTFEYNNDYGFNSLILPVGFASDEEYFNHMLLAVYEYDWNNGEWVEETSSSLYYSLQDVVGINEPQPELIKAYPNPSTGLVTFDLGQQPTPTRLEVFDLQGKRVFAQNLMLSKQQVYLPLGTGTYTYKLIQGQALQSGKVTIMR